MRATRLLWLKFHRVNPDLILALQYVLRITALHPATELLFKC